MDHNNNKNISGAQFTQVAEDFKVQSYSAGVGFESGDVQPPSEMYVTVDDQLLIMCCSFFNANGVNCTVRILNPDGIVVPLFFTIFNTGNRAAASRAFQLIEGYLLSVALTPVFNVTDANGQYASATLVRTPFTEAQASLLLTSGYLSTLTAISWPNQTPQRQSDGSGYVGTAGTFFIATPAAGADLSFSVTTGVKVLIKSLRAILTASAAVSNRNVALQIDDGANVYAMIPSGFAQVAAGVISYTWMDGATAPVTFDNKVVIPLPSNLYLAPGHRISTLTTGIQAGDQWSVPFVLGHQWLNQ